MFGKNQESKKVVDRILINSVGVELGVWKGGSSEKFLKRTSHLHLVDAWAPIAYQESKEHGTFEDYLARYRIMVGSDDPKDFEKFYDNVYKEVVEKFKNKPVTIHRMSTKEFFKKFNEKVDWVYVDAAHDHEGCYNDLISSLKIVKFGGYIYGDDYLNKPGVKSAVNQFIKETDLKFDNFFGSQYEIQVK